VEGGCVDQTHPPRRRLWGGDGAVQGMMMMVLYCVLLPCYRGSVAHMSSILECERHRFLKMPRQNHPGRPRHDIRNAKLFERFTKWARLVLLPYVPTAVETLIYEFVYTIVKPIEITEPPDIQIMPHVFWHESGQLHKYQQYCFRSHHARSRRRHTGNGSNCRIL
jgi:hypothetical protein